MLWYVGYGSNLDRHRMMRYLTGGQAPGAHRAVPGARDSTPPAQERPVVVPGRMVFGWTSLTWGGGVSFLDTDAEGTAYGRAYLLTDQQFADVAAQEMHAEPGTDLELVHVLANRRHTFGPGRYETLCLLGELDGLPLLTFTADDVHALETNAPTASYLATLARGLRETHGLSVEATVDHLLTRPGIGDWTGEGLRSVVG